MKYKMRTMIATGAAMTALALTLGHTALAQSGSAGANPANGRVNGNGRSVGQNFERPADCPFLNEQLTFEEQKARIIDRLVQNETRLKEKLAKADTLPADEEAKEKIRERLTARLQEMAKSISQVNAAASAEELLQFKQERRAGKAENHQLFRGEMQGKGLKQGLMKSGKGFRNR